MLFSIVIFSLAFYNVFGVELKPTREQPHVVLQAHSLNTLVHPEFHQDEKFVPFGDNIEHEYIVQLKEPLLESKNEIESEIDIKFGNYLPHNSFLLYDLKEKIELVQKHNKVLWIGAFLPEYKIAPVLFEEDADEQLDHELFRFAIHFNGKESSKEFAESLLKRITAQSPAGIEILKIEETDSNSLVLITFAKLGNKHALRVARYLSNMPDIHFIEPVGPTKYHLAVAKVDMWSGGSESQPTELNGNGQTVAIGDAGIDSAGCLSGKFVGAVQAAPDQHGTAMGAVVASNVGIAPNAKLAFVSLPANTALAAPEAKFDAAVTQGANIIVSGAGAAATAYNSASASVDAFLARQPLALAIFAAGNSATQLSGPGYSKNALVVGSTNIGPNRHIIGGASPVSGTKDYRFKPDIVASGDGLSLPCGAAMGTSVAAAAAAGAAALARQYYSEGYYPGGAPDDILSFIPTGALLKATLIHSGVDASAVQRNGGIDGAGASPSIVQGFGRIQLSRALFLNNTSPFRTISITDDEELGTGATFRLCITVFDANEPLRVTMTYMDTAADPAAGHSLVNDLDLLVYELETGMEWRGNDAIGFDHSNNVERVSFSPPRPGNYTILVSARKVLTPQKFAMIATGNFVEAACVAQVQLPDNSFTLAYPFAKCPNGCSFFRNQCTNGVCQCDLGSGVDCSLLECPEDCGKFGACDYAVGACRCIQGRRGDGCALTFDTLPPEEVFQTRSTSVYLGYDVGLFAGLFVCLYICGCVCAMACGAIGGQKYLEHKRNQNANV